MRVSFMRRLGGTGREGLRAALWYLLQKNGYVCLPLVPLFALVAIFMDL